MSHARYLVGDVFDRMAELEDGSVDLILTSPPFLALRSYLPADHPDKGREIGSEPTPAVFLDTLLALTAEWRRLLAPHGSICVELGDTYSGNNESGWDRVGARGDQVDNPHGQTYRRIGPPPAARGTGDWPLAKSLCGIPHLYHLSLAYGRNLLTGEPSPAGSWRVRNVVAWCRPNPPVGALGDKFRPGTSYMTVACVSGSRYFDLDAVRTEHKPRWFTSDKPEQDTGVRGDDGQTMRHHANPAGAPPLDWWEIPTQPYKGAHYATWPTELCRKPIESMCPRRVCTSCGRPSERIVEKSAEYAAKGRGWADETDGRRKAAGRERNGHSAQPPGDHIQAADYVTLGWSDCGHDSWRNGLVLDPFAGSGTTLAVATGHGRDAVGIDLDPRNAELVYERIGGLFLEIDIPADAPPADHSYTGEGQARFRPGYIPNDGRPPWRTQAAPKAYGNP